MMTTLALTAALIGFPPANNMNAGIGAPFRDQIDLEFISFAEARCFQSDVSQFPLVTFFSTNPTELSPYGEAVVDWEITALMGETEITFISGWFEYTFSDENGDETATLFGDYLDFNLDPATSEYTLDWKFTGGSGDLEDMLIGFGRTNGEADLVAGCAEYSFNGLLVFEN